MNPISKLQDVTCHMGSHSVTCHPTQVNVPRLTPAGTRFTYPGRMEGWVDLVDLIAPQPGVEPATFWSRVRRRTAAPPRHLSLGRCIVNCSRSIMPCNIVYYWILLSVVTYLKNRSHYRIYIPFQYCSVSLSSASCSDPVGVLGSWPPTFWQWGNPNVDGPPAQFLVPCCYTWPVSVIHSISSADSGWTLHARWFLYLV